MKIKVRGAWEKGRVEVNSERQSGSGLQKVDIVIINLKQGKRETRLEIQAIDVELKGEEIGWERITERKQS